MRFGSITLATVLLVAFASQAASQGGLQPIPCSKEVQDVLTALGNVPEGKVKCTQAWLQVRASNTYWIKGYLGTEEKLVGINVRSDRTAVSLDQAKNFAGVATSAFLHSTVAEKAPNGKLTVKEKLDKDKKLENKYQVIYSNKATAKNLPTAALPTAVPLNITSGHPATKAPTTIKGVNAGARAMPFDAAVSAWESVRSFASKLPSMSFTRRELQSVPAVYDPRTDAKMSKCAALEIQNQGNCGSCWAFALATTYGMQLCKRSTFNIAVSEESIVACNIQAQYSDYDPNGSGAKVGPFAGPTEFTASRKQLTSELTPADGCKGSDTTRATLAVTKDVGASSWLPRSCRLYKSETAAGADIHNTCGKEDLNTCGKDARTLTADGVFEVKGVDNIKAAIYYYGAVAIAVKAETKFNDLKKGDVFDVVATGSPPDSNHAVSAVGFGADYFIVANSWGNTWADGGFFLANHDVVNAEATTLPIVSKSLTELPAGCKTCSNGGIPTANCDACTCPGDWKGADCTDCQAKCGDGGTAGPDCKCMCKPGYFGTYCDSYARAKWTDAKKLTLEWSIIAASFKGKVQTVWKDCLPAADCATIDGYTKDFTAAVGTADYDLSGLKLSASVFFVLNVWLGENEFKTDKGYLAVPFQTLLFTSPCYGGGNTVGTVDKGDNPIKWEGKWICENAGGRRRLADVQAAQCAPGCEASYLGDGYCDDECNNDKCGKDKGDCDVPAECAPGCAAEDLKDGFCDEECRNEKCNFDGGDCPTGKECAPDCMDSYLGDNFCDEECNNAACKLDNGDCDPAKFCAPGCQTLFLKDGYCDDECNNAACNKDGGDCEGIDPPCAEGCEPEWLKDDFCDSECDVPACKNDNGACDGVCAPGCVKRNIGDGTCQKECAVKECYFDMGDCQDVPPCAPGCDVSSIGDGVCDDECNNKDCLMDAGDCDEDTGDRRIRIRQR